MGITRVQYVSANTNGTSLPVTLTSTGAGHLLVAVVAVGSTASIASSSPPTGWTQAVGGVTTESASDVLLYCFYKVDTAGGTTSVTFTNSVSSGITAQVWEFSATNGWPASPVDVTATSPNQAATTSPVTGTTATTAQAEELWIGSVTTHFGTGEVYSSPLNGFTLETTATAPSGSFFAPSTAALYKIVAATGTAGSGVTAGTSKPFAGLVAAFKDNTAGGTPQAIAGTGTASATGTVSLTDSKPLAVTGTATAAGTVALTDTKPIVASGVAQASGTVGITDTKPIVAHGTANAGGAVDLTVLGGLQGNGIASASGTVSLTDSKRIVGSGVASSTGFVALTVVDVNFRIIVGTLALASQLAGTLVLSSNITGTLALSTGLKGTLT